VALNSTVGLLGQVFLGRSFTAHGEVRAVGARVRDELTCSGATSLVGRQRVARRWLVCAGSVYLNEVSWPKAW